MEQVLQVMEREEEMGCDNMWICKPSSCNQGKGIFLMKGLSEERALLLGLCAAH